MHLKFAIDFPSHQALPNIDKVISELTITTGLKFIYNERHFSIECPENGMSLFLVQDSSAYRTSISAPILDYLVASLIYTLKRLGGRLNMELPIWSGQKWNSIKSQFDEDGFPL